MWLLCIVRVFLLLAVPKAVSWFKAHSNHRGLNMSPKATISCLGWGSRTFCLWISHHAAGLQTHMKYHLLECIGHLGNFFPTVTWWTMQRHAQPCSMEAECRGTLLGAQGPALAGSSPTPWLMLLTEGSFLAGLRSGVRNKKHLMLCFIERRERGWTWEGSKGDM